MTRTGWIVLAYLITGPGWASGDGPGSPAQPAPPAKPAVPEWAKVSPAQVTEAERLKVPVAFEDDKTKVRFVLIPGGAFAMGSPVTDEARNNDEGPQHQVTLSPFYLSITEVTNEQFELFVTEKRHQTTAEKDGKSEAISPEGVSFDELSGVNWRQPLFGGERQPDWAQHPVVHVSWTDADAYRQWAKSDLPTEAQFEYALRGGPGRTSVYPWGATATPPERHGNYAGREMKAAFPKCRMPLMYGYDDGYAGTAAVGSFGANPFGLFDISGNVSEWCQDVYMSDFYTDTSPAQRDPVATGSATDPHVTRGGGWYSGGPRSATRVWFVSRYRGGGGLGFRVARPVTAR